MKKLAFMVMSLIIAGCLLASGCAGEEVPTPTSSGEGTEHEGLITTEKTWYAKDNPHVVTGDIMVAGEAGPVLTLEAGVVVKFAPDTILWVGYVEPGALMADGSKGQITFTSGASSPSPGDWKGITFDEHATDGECKLINCLIEYGGGNDKGNIYCYSASPTVKNCTIRRSSSYGIYLKAGSDPLLSGSTFADNAAGDLLE